MYFDGETKFENAIESKPWTSYLKMTLILMDNSVEPSEKSNPDLFKIHEFL